MAISLSTCYALSPRRGSSIGKESYDSYPQELMAWWGRQMSKQIMSLQWSNCQSWSYRNSWRKILSYFTSKEAKGKEVVMLESGFKPRSSDSNICLLSTTPHLTCLKFLKKHIVFGLGNWNIFKCSLASLLCLLQYLYIEIHKFCVI